MHCGLPCCPDLDPPAWGSVEGMCIPCSFPVFLLCQRRREHDFDLAGAFDGHLVLLALSSAHTGAGVDPELSPVTGAVDLSWCPLCLRGHRPAHDLPKALLELPTVQTAESVLV